MRGLRPFALLLLAVAGALVVAASVRAGPAPGAIRGIGFEVEASAASGGPTLAAQGKGTLDVDARNGGDGRITVTRRTSNSRAKTAVAKVLTWHLTTVGQTATVEFSLRVVESDTRKACKLGTKGTATIVDDAAAPENDRVTIGFADGRCRAYAGSWGGQAGGQAQVTVAPVTRRAPLPARPSGTSSMVASSCVEPIRD